MCQKETLATSALQRTLAETSEKETDIYKSAKKKGNKRLKLWEIPDSRHCMIIGTCLSQAEVRKHVARTCGGVSHMNDYQVHTFTVQSVGDKKSSLTIRLQRFLDRKYAVEIRNFAKAKSQEALTKMWNETVSKGTVAGAVWAVSTHAHIDELLGYEVFGEVHMMSHLQGACGRRDNERLLTAQSKVTDLEAEISAHRVSEQRRHERELAQIAQLNQELSALRVSSSQSKPDSARTTAAEKSSKELVRQRQIAVLQSERVERFKEELEELKEHRFEQSKELVELKEVNSRLENTIESLLPCKAKKDECESDLRGRCILYLGGHNHLCQRFRSIVESKKGEFLHHDGGREQQLKQLQGLLQKADMVFCPTERISHNAMNKARKLCKESPDKPIVFLERPSISAFLTGLGQLSDTDKEAKESVDEMS